MHTDSLAHTPDLTTLLDQLSGQGIVVGSRELQRLHTVFATTPDLSRTQLRQVLAALLAKNTYQRHAVFSTYDRLFPPETEHTTTDNDTLLDTQYPASTDTPREEDAEPEQPAYKQAPNLARISLFLLVFVVVTLAAIITVMYWDKSEDNTGSGTDIIITKPPPKPPTETLIPITSELDLIPYIEVWTPQPAAATKADKWGTLLPALLMLIGGGGAFVRLLYQAQARTRSQEKVPQRPKPQGSGRSALLATKRPTFALLSGQQRREVAWSIGRRFDPRPRRQVDVRRTVGESARHAMPHIVFQQTKRTREVWLWRESDLKNPDALQLIRELTDTLQAANISVQTAYFQGVPAHLYTAQGDQLRDLEQHRQRSQPLVLIFMDNAQLGRAFYQQADTVQRTLSQRARWADTVAVDAGQQLGQLHHALKPYRLPCLTLPQVTDWLVQQTKEHATDTPPPIEHIQQWVTACALPARVVLEDEARALHDDIGLNVPWHYPQLQAYSTDTRTDLDLRAQRIPLLNRFAHHWHQDVEWTQTALRFWRQRLRELDQQLTDTETADKPWQNTQAYYRDITLNQALLSLWDKPETAIQQLYDLHDHKDLANDVEQHVACYQFTAQPDTQHNDPQRITLPHDWQDLPLETQRQAIIVGLGQPAQAITTQADHVTRRLLGLFAGITCAGLLGSAYALYPQPVDFQLAANSAAPPTNRVAPATWVQERSGSRYLIGDPKSEWHTAGNLEAGQVVPLRWQRDVVRAQQPLSDDSKHWRLGENASPTRPAQTGDQQPWPTWSLAVIRTSATDTEAQALAAKLLDTGSVDQVIIGTDAEAHDAIRQLKTLSKALTPNFTTQWLDLPKSGIPPLQQALAQQDGVFQYVEPYAGQQVWLNGQRELGGILQRKTIELPHGMTLQRLPAGSFRMGDDNSQYDDEKPAHTVTIAQPFYMGQTEVTFAQYDAYLAANDGKERPKDEGWGRDTRPVINVNWQDTQDYLQWLSTNQQDALQGLVCRLPSEAEWEYAARAGTTTNYFWGNEVGENNANCRSCGSQWDSEKTAPVASFKPNDWGLYDMHGNVWEWTQDRWHDSYQDAPTDGSAWEAGDNTNRVVRGGSWLNGPDNLRSSIRINDRPVVRNYVGGFRVVCSPPSADD